MEKEIISAVFQMVNDGYAPRERTTIVITEKDDAIAVGVKALARVYEHNVEGLTVYEEQHGDYRTLSKDASIGLVLDIIKDLFDKVPEIIEKTPNGDKA